MGNNSSKDPVEIEKKRPPQCKPINGLKTGDVVVVKGEAFAGAEKFIYVNFHAGDDNAFFFKAVLLEAEGVYNRIKMNSFRGGKWEQEIQKENAIFVNHYFELKFTCNEKEFTVDVNGTTTYSFEHRYPPDKITSIRLAGDANWTDFELPNEVKPMTRHHDVPDRFPTPEEMTVFLHGLRASLPAVRSDVNEEKRQEFFELITKSLDLTKKLLGENKSTWETISGLSGYLKNAFSVGSAIFGFIDFVTKIGKESDLTEIKRTLKNIDEQLVKIGDTLKDGFATIIQHSDYTVFRESVQNPLLALFDQYKRCQTVNETGPLEMFKALCVKTPPREIFSKMYGYLVSENNIIETHLNAKKYVYSEYEGWSKLLFDYSFQLITINMFYYGVLCAEHEAKGDKTVLFDAEREITDLMQQLERMRTRLQQIEEVRFKKFMSEDHANYFIKEKFKSLKYEPIDSDKRLPLETLSTIAYQMKNAWKGFNGPSDFHIIAVRGSASPRYSSSRCAMWVNGDNTKVTVAKDVGGMVSNHDGICIALIQPVTQEMRDANEKARVELKDKIAKALQQFNGCTVTNWGHERKFDDIKKALSSIPHNPLLMIYNFDFYQNGWKFITLYDKISEDSVKAVPTNYQITGEAWSCPGGPLHWNYYYGCHPNIDTYNLYNVQILFQ